MMSLKTKLDKLKEALISIENLKVYHYWRPITDVPVCIWQESDDFGSLQANNHKAEQLINGTIDLFTKEENDSFIDEIQEVLNSLENCRWGINSIQYENETNLIHYEWSFTLL